MDRHPCSPERLFQLHSVFGIVGSSQPFTEGYEYTGHFRVFQYALHECVERGALQKISLHVIVDVEIAQYRLAGLDHRINRRWRPVELQVQLSNFALRPLNILSRRLIMTTTAIAVVKQR